MANAESWFNPESGVTYSPASQPFIESMSLNGTFDLTHVWKQQAEDTHPPFYYDLSEHFDSIKEWYNGYQFGKAYVYCPWDVISYCDALLEDPDSEPEDYWTNTSDNGMILRFIDKANRNPKTR